MIPVMLDPARLKIGLVGRAALAQRRLDWFKALGGAPDLYSDAPEGAFARANADLIMPRLPDRNDLAGMDLMWIADLDAETAGALTALARAAKVLVNVEDVLPHCDFHTPAVLRRGRLVIAAATGGASPAAASLVREKLETAFPDAWSVALDAIADARTAMREAGETPAAIAADARARLAAAGLI